MDGITGAPPVAVVLNGGYLCLFGISLNNECTIFAGAMDLLELIFAGFMIYLLYKLVFGLIMPVSKAASQMKSKMNDFQRMQQEQMRQQQTSQAARPQTRPTPTAKPSKDDYIDFEEVK